MMGKEDPVLFISQTLSKSERGYSVTEIEVSECAFVESRVLRWSFLPPVEGSRKSG